MAFSFAVTAFDEISKPQQFGGRLQKCISAAQEHPGIDEIVIVNDGPAGLKKLEAMFDGASKVKLFSNADRMGVFTNKIEAVARATNDWVITCDSDNFMDIDFLDTMIRCATNKKTWYCPSFAKPQFDYRKLTRRWNLNTIRFFFNTPIAACAANTGNWTVYGPRFMHVMERFRGVRRFDLMLPNYAGLDEKTRQSEDWHLAYGACDSILLNIEWLQSGGTLEFCEGLEYDHAVHVDKSGSNYDRAPAEKERLATLLRQHLAAGTLPRPGGIT